MLSEAVAHAAEHFGDTPSIVREGVGPTWAELHAASEALAPMLARRGVGPGDVVALALPSGPEWLVAATATDRLGGTIAGVSPVATAAERSAMVDSVDSKLVLASEDLAQGLSLRRQVSVFGPDGLDDERLGRDHAAIAPHDRGPERRYAICFTSGTTGAPKAASFAVRQAAAVESIDLGSTASASGFDTIASTQFAHVGFVMKAPWYARLGCTVHVMPRWTAPDAIRLLAQHRMPTLGVVAPQLALILASDELAEHDLSALALVIAGGAPSPPDLVSRARSVLGVSYSIRWSSTESGGVGLAALIDDDNPDAIGTIGMPRTGVAARVAEEDGMAVSQGEVGELQINSPATMDGYMGDPAATDAAFTPDGWLRTGDLAHVRPDGRFVLDGRNTDMYIRGGYNVHPEEVEAVVGAHPAVRAVAIAPRSDSVMGEVGVAVVVPEATEPAPTLEDLRATASLQLARHKLPEAMLIVDRLPLTDASKIDRIRLAELVKR
ncbi:MAG: class I adenylate-forming enzyme family protein [Microthrixaceae bacterium]